MEKRTQLIDKKRIVIKLGTSSITHEKTGALNLTKLERLVREVSDLKNMGKEIILVSSGAIAVGKSVVHLKQKPETIAKKQACAAIGQANLMRLYQKLFAEYNQTTAQILMTKDTVLNNLSRMNALNTFQELMEMDVIPIVNENDTISTYEIEFGDNDTLSAIVASLINADLLILLSDIDGLFTDDPNQNPKAKFIDVVEEIDQHFLDMGKDSTGSSLGTGGMTTKLSAARLATDAGVDMIIANGEDFRVIHKIIQGENYGTLFTGKLKEDFYLIDYLEKIV